MAELVLHASLDGLRGDFRRLALRRHLCGKRRRVDRFVLLHEEAPPTGRAQSRLTQEDGGPADVRQQLGAYES